MADSATVFTQLCDEILARINETSGDDWWKDIQSLSESLELARRQLDRPAWPYANDPEWPACLIFEAHRDQELFGLGQEFSTTVTRFFTDDSPNFRVDAVGMLLTRDPLAESYSEGMLWYVESDTKQRHLLGEKREKVITTVRRWRRAVDQGLLAVAVESDDEDIIESDRDVFLCHASEDKTAVVRPIATALKQAGISFWFDETEILWGDSLTDKVNEGLRMSRFAVVVLSKAFLEKHWPKRELNAVLNLEATTGETRILPLLIGTAEERAAILQQLPLLNDKLYTPWNGDAEGVVEALRSRLKS